MNDIGQAIKKKILENKVLLFMKGSKSMPCCGFSAAVVNILNNMKVSFETIDVLKDENIRQGIKDYSDWPTIPQLYVDGEFIGGCDIIQELYLSDELTNILNKISIIND